MYTRSGPLNVTAIQWYELVRDEVTALIKERDVEHLFGWSEGRHHLFFQRIPDGFVELGSWLLFPDDDPYRRMVRVVSEREFLNTFQRIR